MLGVAHARLFREYLDACDVIGVRHLWQHIAPHLPQPKNDFETMVMIHRARTETIAVPLAKRAYSHHWLVQNGLPSGLPDHLKPKAERYGYKFAYGVGIGMKVAGNDPTKRALAKAVQTAMGRAVSEAFADGRTDGEHLRRRMLEAKQSAVRSFGRPCISVKISFDFAGLPPRLKQV